MTDPTNPDGFLDDDAALIAEAGDADDDAVRGTFGDNADEFDPNEPDAESEGGAA